MSREKKEARHVKAAQAVYDSRLKLKCILF
jgi:hypothetical protein